MFLPFGTQSICIIHSAGNPTTKSNTRVDSMFSKEVFYWFQEASDSADSPTCISVTFSLTVLCENITKMFTGFLTIITIKNIHTNIKTDYPEWNSEIDWWTWHVPYLTEISYNIYYEHSMQSARLLFIFSPVCRHADINYSNAQYLSVYSQTCILILHLHYIVLFMQLYVDDHVWIRFSRQIYYYLNVKNITMISL